MTKIPWLEFTINDEWGISMFSSLGQSGPVKHVHSRYRCCEYSSGRIMPPTFIQIHSSKDDMSVCVEIIDMTLQTYVESNNFSV